MLFVAEVKVLVEGYAKKLANGWIASSTVCLVKSGSRKIIVDHGCNLEKLLRALVKEKLATNDIDYVFMSHSHPDHILLSGIFERAKFVTFDSNLLYDKDMLTGFGKDILGTEIEVIETPGHVPEHISLLVDTLNGKIAIAGDAIFWIEGEDQVFDINQKDHSQAKGIDMKNLVAFSKKLIEAADYIIPGHGKIFKVKK